MINTLEHIIKKYKIDTTQQSPIMLPIGRFNDIPKLFNELGFKTGAEVGVFAGNYSRKLLSRIPGLKLYGIDLWDYYKDYKDFDAFPDLDLPGAYLEAQKNVEGYDCELIKGWSRDIVKQFEDESLDFVFIDGNHAYEYVVEDIALWSKKVKRGGIVYGHDYDDWSNKKRWEGMNVVNAVDGWTKSYKIKPWFVIVNNSNKCWMYVKGDY